MSYLDVPRLHFSGQFRADVCTVNNHIANYHATDIKYDERKIGGFNPYGTGNWTIENCIVTSVIGKDGTLKTQGDLIGQTVQSMSPGKLVDLDPQQMMVSEIWGLRIQIGNDYNSDSVYGHFTVAPFMDIWSRAPGNQNARDFSQSAFYQSTLTDLKWGPNLASRFLHELKEVSPDMLSIKFTVDGYNMTNGDPQFTYGRIVGTIGPASPDEPAHFVAERLLRPTKDSTHSESKLNYAPFRLVEVQQSDGLHRKVVVDLGNSIPTESPGGDPSVANGPLSLIMLDGPVKSLGEIDTTATAYTDRALVQEFDLNQIAHEHELDPTDLCQSVAHTPLAVIDQDGTHLLVERDDGILIQADKFVYRLNPPEGGIYPETEAQRTVNLRISHFGQPVPSGQINLFDASSHIQAGHGEQEDVGTPPTALSYPKPKEPIDVHEGKAQFVLTPADPGNPRQTIDGQIYGVGYKLATDNEAEDLFNFVSVIVHTLTTWNKANPPTWNDHIKPIFTQYARLYPVMKKNFGVQLDSYDYIKGNPNANGILQVMFSEKIENPAYMPVSRDLSHSKHEMIMAWFKAGMPEG